LGIVHVLTGPDHLSALATLSTPEKSTRNSFFLGLQWGIGHSVGLLLVYILALLSLTLTNVHDSSYAIITIPSQVTMVLESFVGIFMIGLGIYGIHGAIRKRQRPQEDQDPHAHAQEEEEEGQWKPPIQSQISTTHPHDIELSTPTFDSSTLPKFIRNEQGEASMSISDVATTSDGRIPSHSYEPPTPIVFMDPPKTKDKDDDDDNNNNNNNQQQEENNNEDEQQALAEDESHGGHHHHHHSYIPFCCSCCFPRSKSTTSMLALMAGLLHGVAGPGGILGVLPAVQMKNPLWGSLYLITFCICSTITMGIFAAIYGTLFGTCQGPWEFRMECLSASLSVMVGILWLTLLSLGKLEAIFGD
jgi:ABC-type nickel/cobalt efflux system permease component RcnA